MLAVASIPNTPIVMDNICSDYKMAKTSYTQLLDTEFTLIYDFQKLHDVSTAYINGYASYSDLEKAKQKYNEGMNAFNKNVYDFTNNSRNFENSIYQHLTNYLYNNNLANQMENINNIPDMKNFK